MSKHFVNIHNVSAFEITDKLSNEIWEIVSSWDTFAKRTIGEQLVKSCDSISANIAEGFGRYFRKDKIKFYYYARGSTIETSIWIDKAMRRNLINKDQYISISRELETILRQINTLIRITHEKLNL